jgi:hydrogenase-4 component F
LAGAAAVLGLAAAAALRLTGGGAMQAAGGGLSLDPLAALYLLLVAFVGVTEALYSIGYLRARMAEAGPGQPPPRYRQYYPLFNLFLGSILSVPLISNLAVVWIAIELTTIFSAFLVAFEDRAEALEAAWKYVALTTMGAMIALFGVLVLYYGVNHAGQPVTWPGLARVAPRLPPAVLLVAFVLWLIGFGAKTGLVPVHTWLPDAHSQAPASICAVLSGVETSAALYMLLRLYPALAANPGIAHPENWYRVAGLITVATAAFLLLQVQDFKRLFAYSTVEHMGIILTACGLGAGHQLGTIYQLFAHAFSKSFCFYAAGLATVAFGSQRITAVGGLLSKAPVAGWALLAGGLAIAGAPPFALFISEFTILRTGFAAGAYAATGLLTALLILAFVAILVQIGRIVFGEPRQTPRHEHGPLPVTSVAATGLALIPMLVFGFYLPPPLAALISHAAATLGGSS